jgi:hypothetical protein
MSGKEKEQLVDAVMDLLGLSALRYVHGTAWLTVCQSLNVPLSLSVSVSPCVYVYQRCTNWR